MTLGFAAILSSFGVAYGIGSLNRLNYNIWYGDATKNLIETTIEGIESGKVDQVVSVLRGLHLNLAPTYESRANYDQLVEKAILQMKD